MSDFKFNNTVNMFQDVSFYDQEKTQLQTADQPMALLQKYKITNSKKKIKSSQFSLSQQDDCKIRQDITKQTTKQGLITNSRSHLVQQYQISRSSSYVTELTAYDATRGRSFNIFY